MDIIAPPIKSSIGAEARIHFSQLYAAVARIRLIASPTVPLRQFRARRKWLFKTVVTALGALSDAMAPVTRTASGAGTPPTKTAPPATGAVVRSSCSLHSRKRFCGVDADASLRMRHSVV